MEVQNAEWHICFEWWIGGVCDGTGHDPLKIFTRIYLQENHKNISVQQSNMEYPANSSYPQSN